VTKKKAATQPVRPTQAKKEITNNHSLIALLLPLGTLLGGVFIGILYTGGFFLLGGTNSFIDAFAYNDQTFFCYVYYRMHRPYTQHNICII